MRSSDTAIICKELESAGWGILALDRCPKCHGFLFDAGELLALEAADTDPEEAHRRSAPGGARHVGSAPGNRRRDLPAGARPCDPRVHPHEQSNARALPGVPCSFDDAGRPFRSGLAICEPSAVLRHRSRRGAAGMELFSRQLRWPATPAWTAAGRLRSWAAPLH